MNSCPAQSESKRILFNKEPRKIEIFIPGDCMPSNRRDGCYKANICYVIAHKKKIDTTEMRFCPRDEEA